MQGVVQPEELLWLRTCPHMPTAVCQVLSARFQAMRCCQASVFKQLALEEQLTLYSQTVVGCERILRQPIPIAYTR